MAVARFGKAKAEQAALKASIYGPPGSGKTFSALLVAEGLARAASKRIAFLDTEHGTDFYSMAVPAREPHPEPFDFDALYTRSLSEANDALRALDPAEHGVVVIDSITHLWEAAKLAYGGRKPGGKIPFHAWDGIKRPYKAMMQFLVNCPMHVLILGRQGNDFVEDDEGETKAAGVKMKAEGETQYEPHVCVRMESVKGKSKTKPGVITAYIEKDRTGLLQGRVIEWPDFETLGKPVLGLLGASQAQLESEESAAARDVAASRGHRVRLDGEFATARTSDEVEAVGAGIKAIKAALLPADWEAVKDAYRMARDRVREAAEGKDDSRQSLEDGE